MSAIRFLFTGVRDMFTTATASRWRVALRDHAGRPLQIDRATNPGALAAVRGPDRAVDVVDMTKWLDLNLGRPTKAFAAETSLGPSCGCTLPAPTTSRATSLRRQRTRRRRPDGLARRGADGRRHWVLLHERRDVRADRRSSSYGKF